MYVILNCLTLFRFKPCRFYHIFHFVEFCCPIRSIIFPCSTRDSFFCCLQVAIVEIFYLLVYILAVCFNHLTVFVCELRKEIPVRFFCDFTVKSFFHLFASIPDPLSATQVYDHSLQVGLWHFFKFYLLGYHLRRLDQELMLSSIFVSIRLEDHLGHL